MPKGPYISYLEAGKLVTMKFIYHFVLVNDSCIETPPIKLVQILSEFLEVLHVREIYFIINIHPDTRPISVTTYRMTETELKELKLQLKNNLDEGFIQPSVSPWVLRPNKMLHSSRFYFI